MSKIPHFEIVRASRRSISIQISPSKGLIVRAPFSVPTDIIHAFVERKSDWITKHISRLSKTSESKNNVLYYLGQPHSFEYNLLQKEAVIHSEGMFTFNRKTKDTGTEQKVLILWYRKQAQRYLSERIVHISRENDLEFNGMRITSATTRWGSCSGRNNLNFPWRLMMAPREVIDYVVVHELAHTVHKNHSVRFWNLVELIMPDWKAHRNYLKTNGGRYMLPKF